MPPSTKTPTWDVRVALYQGENLLGRWTCEVQASTLNRIAPCRCWAAARRAGQTP